MSDKTRTLGLVLLIGSAVAALCAGALFAWAFDYFGQWGGVLGGWQ